MRRGPFILATVGLLFAGCNDSETFKKNNGEIVSTIASDAKSDAELEAMLKEIEQEEAQKKAEEKKNSTSLSFDRVRHDFGNVRIGSQNNTEFIVTNTGDKPLIIEDVSASCGCTTPKKPEKPILPGKSDVIQVGFEPKPGQLNEIVKTVTVTANSPERVHKLEIRAFVKE